MAERFITIHYMCGGMAERFKAAVLKTVVDESLPRVRIPIPPHI